MLRAGQRIVALLVLLAIALALSAALTWRALSAERQHRQAAARFLADYAGILSDDVVRRTVYELETFYFGPLRGMFRERVLAHKPLPDAEELRASPQPQTRRIGALVDRVFAADFAAGTVSPPLSPALDRWVLTTLEHRARDAGRTSTNVVRAQLADRDVLIVFASFDLARRKLYGATVRRDELARVAAEAFARRPVFPPAFANRGVTDDDFFIRMEGRDGVLLRRGGLFEPATGTTYRVIDKYPEPLRGAVVQASIGERGARLLIPGGVPRARTPLLLLMLAITGGVLTAAVFVAYRERQLDLLRADLMAGVSHELRTPLTHIRMFAETLLLNRVRSDDERRRSLEIVHQEAGRLANLVDNLLFFERGSRREPVAREPFDVTATVHAAVDAFAPIANARKTAIHVDTSRAGIVHGDPDAFKQILINLLDNAVKYGPAGQTVTVCASVEEETAVLTVDDEGPGIPRNERARVWERFFRLSRDRATHRAGSGIGLAVVRELVQRHGGACRVDDAPSGGARFVVTFPAGAWPA